MKRDPTTHHDPADRRVTQVRKRYTQVAKEGGVGDASGEIGPDKGSERFGYDPAEIESLPSGADMGLGCGAPVSLLELQPGETVLDLGSGGGIDVFLAARQVGPSGRAIGVDMTPGMIEVAREAARAAGVTNVEFREGRLEALPIEDASIDAATSNCVINLVPDKGAVFRELARVLRPGGRLVISDVILERPLPQALIDALGEAGEIMTAVPRPDYLRQIRDAGLGTPEILTDVDYLETVGWTSADRMNVESRALLARAGVDFEQIRGTVRSITYRAVRPAA